MKKKIVSSECKSRSSVLDTLERIEKLLEKLTIKNVESNNPAKVLSLYVLELVGNKYYVGISEDLDKRIKEHFSGEGSEWTKLHKPIKVVETRLNIHRMLEKDVTLAYMKQYGWRNVRGYAWSQRNMRNAPKALQ